MNCQRLKTANTLFTAERELKTTEAVTNDAQNWIIQRQNIRVTNITLAIGKVLAIAVVWYEVNLARR